MISLTEARTQIWERLSTLPSHSSTLEEAYGHVLREDVYALKDIPAFDRSAMDGYALIADDDTQWLRIVGEIQPGITLDFIIEYGECARIFTGAIIPEGASQVKMQEDAHVENRLVKRMHRSSAKHIRRLGENARRGDPLLPVGTRLGEVELSLLAGIGITQPIVSPFIKIAHFVTGNEIVPPSHTPEPAQIRDSNSTLVAAFVRRLNDKIMCQEQVPNNFDLLLHRVQSCDNDYDLLLISCGASIGDYDFGKRLLCALGFEVHFEKVNLRPGSPLIFATRGKQGAFVLPGNPVSHFVPLHMEVQLALKKSRAQKLPGMSSRHGSCNPLNAERTHVKHFGLRA